MGKLNRAEHLCFGQFVGFGLNHHHGVFCTSNNQIKALFWVVAQLVHVVHGWVQHIFAVNKTNTTVGDWAHERCTRECKRSGCSDHCYHVWVIFQIVGQNCEGDLCFVFKARDEQWADWTVDQACRQCFFFCWACFTLKETTWDFTRGVVFFLVVYCQWKEIHSWLFFLRKDNGGQNRCLTHSGDYCAVGLAGDFTCFQSERFAAPFD